IQTEVLYKKAIELANLKKDDVVLDAYCGVGTIGLIVSSKVKSVVGVEISNSAIEDARYNASINKIKNAEFVVGDAKEFIKKEVKNNKKYDVVFVDPPRDGCDKEFIGSLVKMLPPRIIYISCEPSSLSRDLLELSKYYDVSYCQPVDMFPQTYHVESVVSLVLKK
ncbi:MAG: 23S rRNA (uracil(1939)-C(5))-methyltransferase RlmD, partial [Candidatus ainarchaeum sp.]|nr:23S rRNA (uracil(1939)-C(5))-methyltransferase RlmD [Candidatus ainarchaeum sp.]